MTPNFTLSAMTHPLRILLIGAICWSLPWVGTAQVLPPEQELQAMADAELLSLWRASADEAYQGLADKIACWGNNWQTGCSFDTALDYVRMQLEHASSEEERTAAKKSGQALVVTAKERWRSQHKSMCWYDDYSWWGIASAKAYDPTYDDVFGKTGQQYFRDLTFKIWSLIFAGEFEPVIESIDQSCTNDINMLKGGATYRGGAPNAWTNLEKLSKKNRTYFSKPGPTWAKPRIEGGVWQYDLFKYGVDQDQRCIANKSVGDPSIVDLGPFQDTVINGLYLVLASRLALIAEQDVHDLPSVLEFVDLESAASTQRDFMQKWFEIKNQYHSLLWYYKLSPKKAVVRERVATYASFDGGKTYPEVRNFDPVRAWAGDQGLVLGGLVDFHRLDASDAQAQDLALAILAGVADLLTTDQVVQPSFPPFYPNQAFFSSSDDDYSSGAGIFWRYLLYAYRHNDQIRARILTEKIDPDDPQSPTYLDVVRLSGQAASRQAKKLVKDNSKNPPRNCSTVPCPPYQCAGPCGAGNGIYSKISLFDWFNPVAALTAAITILEDAQQTH